MLANRRVAAQGGSLILPFAAVSANFPALDVEPINHLRTHREAGQTGSLRARSHAVVPGPNPASGRPDSRVPELRRRGRANLAVHRSEEHTSELQSHLNLVCRL